MSYSPFPPVLCRWTSLDIARKAGKVRAQGYRGWAADLREAAHKMRAAERAVVRAGLN